MIKISAPGKVHLIGEHAVVYGHPAIIAAVGRRIYIEAEKSDSVILEDERFNRRLEWSVTECKEAAEHSQHLLKQCAEKGNYSDIIAWAKDSGSYNVYWKAMFGIVLNMVHADSGIKIHVTRCDIPTGSGLGSSSAAAVAIAKAASEVYHKLPIEKVNEITYECERLV